MVVATLLLGLVFAAKGPIDVDAEGEAWAQGRDPGFNRRAAALCRGTADEAGCVEILQAACADDRAGAGPEMLENEVDAILTSVKATRKRHRAAAAIIARDT